MKIFVIAGTAREATEWARSNLQKRIVDGENPVGLSEYVYVTGIDSLRGYQDPHGVLVGTWRERIDIEQVVELLFMQTIHVNKQLEMIRQEVKLLKKRPTPKLKPVTGGWINEQFVGIAAQQLAKAIDNHVLEEIKNGNALTP